MNLFNKSFKDNLHIVLLLIVVIFTIYLFKGKVESFNNPNVIPMKMYGILPNGDLWGSDGGIITKQIPRLNLVSISYKNNNIYAVNKNGNIQVINITVSKNKANSISTSFIGYSSPIQFVQISYDHYLNSLVGVDKNDDIYFTYPHMATSSGLKWTKIDGKLINVSASNGKLYGVNRDNDIYYCSNYMKQNPIWKKLNGKLKQIEFRSYGSLNALVGVNSNNDVYYADKNIESNPEWQQINGTLKMNYVTFSNDIPEIDLVGIDLQYNSWVYLKTKKWFQHTKIPKLKTISFTELNPIGIKSPVVSAVAQGVASPSPSPIVSTVAQGVANPRPIPSDADIIAKLSTMSSSSQPYCNGDTLLNSVKANGGSWSVANCYNIKPNDYCNGDTYAGCVKANGAWCNTNCKDKQGKSYPRIM
jgi:hypothetical protein